MRHRQIPDRRADGHALDARARRTTLTQLTVEGLVESLVAHSQKSPMRCAIMHETIGAKKGTQVRCPFCSDNISANYNSFPRAIIQIMGNATNGACPMS